MYENLNANEIVVALPLLAFSSEQCQLYSHPNEITAALSATLPNEDRGSHIHGQLLVISEPNPHVFGSWEKGAAPGGNPPK